MTLFTEFGRYLLMIKGMFSRPENGRMYWKELMHQCSEIGIRVAGHRGDHFGVHGTVSSCKKLPMVSNLIPRSTIAQIVRDTVILEFALPLYV